MYMYMYIVQYAGYHYILCKSIYGTLLFFQLGLYDHIC